MTLMTMSWAKLPFLLHALIETVAARQFILAPDTQVARPSQAAVLVCQSLGGLLLSTNLLCVGVLVGPGPAVEGLGRWAAASLALWHLWPCRRAWVRLRGGGHGPGEEAQKRTLGGPGVHLGVHGVLFGMFAWVAVL
ncbi:hypothetical protein ACHAQA_009573 [Verticillium albo-atrum]